MADKSIHYTEMAQLINKCAAAMDAEDKRRREAGDLVFHGVASGPTTKGLEICITIAANEGFPEWGRLVYYLLAYTWNDVLDWAKDYGS